MDTYSSDFAEISHCGVQATFTVRWDSDGRRRISTRLQGTSGNPMAMIAIYVAVPQGIPISDVSMGGIGQPFSTLPPPHSLLVYLGSDSEGRWGHQCPECGGYFRNGRHSAMYPLTCPYCGLRADAYTFLTEAHSRYAQLYISAYIEALSATSVISPERQFVIDMDEIAELSVDQRSDFYYTSQTQQTRFTCPKCGEFNDIRGKFGYCASCGLRNNLASVEETLKELRTGLTEKSMSPETVISKAVSVFDASCRDTIEQLKSRVPLTLGRRNRLDNLSFHNMERLATEIEAAFGIQMLRGSDPETINFLKIMIQRRHIFEHRGGVADDAYVNNSGDNLWRSGDLIRETAENAPIFLTALLKIARNIHEYFHEIFPLIPEPIEHFQVKSRK
jgi:ribosomal protein L37AE/L43A